MSYFALRHARRFHDVLRILVRYGYGPLLERLPLPFNLSFRRRGVATSGEELARQTRLALEELGPTYVKAGQMMSTRYDLVPPAFIDELKSLQENVAPVPFEEIRQVVIDELGAPPDEIFSAFSEEPLASASIAQVHTAMYRGTQVVVKIQRPGIARTIEQDMEIVALLANLIDEHVAEAKPYGLPGMVREFGRGLRGELNFEREADNVEVFRTGFADDPNIVIPRVFREVSGDRVLTLSHISGRRVDDLSFFPPDRRRHLAQVAVDMSMHQVFELGAYHVDPHPGNLLVVGLDRLAILDYGMVGLIDDDSINDLVDLFLALTERDYAFLVEILLEIGQPRGNINIQELRHELMELVEHNYAKDLQGFNLGQVLIFMMQILRRHRITMPASYISLVRALVAAESSARLIYPDLRLADEIRPRIRSVLFRRWDWNDLRSSATVGIRRIVRRFSHWTGQVGSLVDRADRGEFSIKFQHVGLESFLGGLEKIAQRISLAVLIAALIIGGSLIIQFDRPPYLLGYPALGMVSYIGALILGVILVSLGRR